MLERGEAARLGLQLEEGGDRLLVATRVRERHAASEQRRRARVVQAGAGRRPVQRRVPVAKVDVRQRGRGEVSLIAVEVGRVRRHEQPTPCELRDGVAGTHGGGSVSRHPGAPTGRVMERLSRQTGDVSRTRLRARARQETRGCAPGRPARRAASPPPPSCMTRTPRSDRGACRCATACGASAARPGTAHATRPPRLQEESEKGPRSVRRRPRKPRRRRRPRRRRASRRLR